MFKVLKNKLFLVLAVGVIGVSILASGCALKHEATAKSVDMDSRTAREVLTSLEAKREVKLVTSTDFGWAALNRLRKLRIAEVENDFELGGVLSRVKDEGWFGDYESFEELIQAEFGFGKT